MDGSAALYGWINLLNVFMPLSFDNTKCFRIVTILTQVEKLWMRMVTRLMCFIATAT